MTPSRTLPSISLIVRTRIAPAAAILSISSGVLRMITARSSSRSVAIVARMWSWTSVGERVPSKRRSRPRSRRSRSAARSARGRPARRLRIVSGLSSSRWTSCGAVDVADALALGRVELDVVDAARPADATARQAAHDLVVGHLDEQDGGELAPELVELVVERLGLADRAREAVEQEAVAGVLAVDLAPRITPMMTSSGTSSPASMWLLACLPSGVPSATASRSMSPVAM